MIETRLIAKDISCEHCAAAIKRELGGVTGVSAVAVHVAAKAIHVNHDDDETLDRVLSLLAEIGYPADRA